MADRGRSTLPARTIATRNEGPTAPDGSGPPLPALLRRFALIFLSIATLLSVALMLATRLSEQQRLEAIETEAQSHITVTGGHILADMEKVNADLRLIAGLPQLQNFLDTGSPAELGEAAEIFLLLAKETRLYDQIRYLDASGQEVVRVNFNDGSPSIVPAGQLQNKAGRYYFADAFSLDRGAIFVSPLDLNIEHGRLELPYKPMIRFGMPVFDRTGSKRGIVLLNYLGAYLLQHFRDIMQESSLHAGMLINRDGYWLSSPKREDEWGFMLGQSERSFRHDFPEAWQAISSSEKGALPTEQGLFVYATVYPLQGEERSSTGSPLAHGSSQAPLPASDYYWKIVSFIPQKILAKDAFYNRTGGRAAIILACLLLALAAWVLARATLSRDLAEKRLIRNERLYHDLIEMIPHGIQENNPDGIITYSNTAHARMHGYEKGELVGRAIWEMRQTEAEKRELRDYLAFLVKEQPNPITYFARDISRDGRLIDIQVDWNYRRNEAGALTGFVSAITDITEHKQAERARELLLQENRALMRLLIAVQEEERRLLARDLHDELGQLLTSINARAEYIARYAADEKIRANAGEIIRDTKASFEASRAVLQRLRPATLDALGIADALAELAGRWQAQTGVDCSLQVDGDFEQLKDPHAITIYRLVQEGLTNVSRHAGAKHVEILLKQEAGQIIIRISDDGIGRQAEETTEGMGIIGMRERAHALGGSFLLGQPSQGGTRIEVALPWDGGQG